MIRNLIVFVLLFWIIGTASPQSPCDTIEQLNVDQTAKLDTFLNRCWFNKYEGAYELLDQVLIDFPCQSPLLYPYCIYTIKDKMEKELINVKSQEKLSALLMEVYAQWIHYFPQYDSTIKAIQQIDSNIYYKSSDQSKKEKIELVDSTLRDFFSNIYDPNYPAYETPPKFPGGTSKLKSFLGKNYNYPRTAIENNIQGKIFLTFVIETNGKVTNVKILQGLCPPCDKEAIRLVKSMPNWKPGLKRGKPVRVQFNLPIALTLN